MEHRSQGPEVKELTDVMSCTYNLSTQKTEARDLSGVQGQPGLA